jgi:hypothetical protein
VRSTQTVEENQSSSEGQTNQGVTVQTNLPEAPAGVNVGGATSSGSRVRRQQS